MFLLIGKSGAARDFYWFKKGKPISYSLEADKSPVIATALALWQSDMEQVTGLKPKIQNKGQINIMRA